MKTSEYDVVVLGAGAAGIAAAIGAARRGGVIRLLDRDTGIGGSATRAMVGTICGLARCGPLAPRTPSFDNPGFASEFSRRVAAASGTTLEMNTDGLAYLPYNARAFEQIARQMIDEGQRISLSLNAFPTSISRSSRADPFEILIQHEDGAREELRAQAVIDSTGSARVSELLNLAVAKPARYQAASLIFELSGLPPLEERLLGLTIRKALREASLEGALSERLSYVSIVPGSYMVDRPSRARAFFKLGTRAPQGEDTEERIYAEALDGVTLIVASLHDRLPEFQRVHHSQTAPRLGVRGGYRGVGEEELSDSAVKRSERHIKGIALGLWPSELWETPARPIVTFPEQGHSYEISLGSLCAQSTPGVYFAGRVISASDYAIASARVIGTCLSTGYAAGRAAAGAVRGESEASIIASIREEQVDPFYENSADRA